MTSIVTLCDPSVVDTLTLVLTPREVREVLAAPLELAPMEWVPFAEIKHLVVDWDDIAAWGKRTRNLPAPPGRIELREPCRNCLGAQPGSCLVCGGSGSVPRPWMLAIEQPCPDCDLVGGPMVECDVCHRRKTPYGRAAPLEMANGQCGVECSGYRAGADAGQLWPGERWGDSLHCIHERRQAITARGEGATVLRVRTPSDDDEFDPNYITVNELGVWRWRGPGAYDYDDLTDEPWATNLTPGMVVVRFDRVVKLDEPIAGTKCNYCGGYGWTADTDPDTGEPIMQEQCPCIDGSQPLDLHPGQVHEIELEP